MVPKRMEASWAALVPPGLSSSSSSDSSSSLSEPQSSSSGRFLDTGPVGAAAACVRRWKGLVDSAGAGGAGGAAVGAAAAAAELPGVDGASED